MKRWNGISMGEKVTLPVIPRGRDPRIRKYVRPVTPYVLELIAETERRDDEVKGRTEPNILAQEMLTMLHTTGDRTIKGLAKDLHLPKKTAHKVVKYLKKKKLVETWKNKRKVLCVGGV